ncbi:hypothetical protein GE09DRAFT_292851 [Coniochaeta sp. 2T2.1]|nr:hypothetical protein GE09DRAFT_292851 [Coniochaeta sp. 2T2.1]
MDDLIPASNRKVVILRAPSHGRACLGEALEHLPQAVSRPLLADQLIKRLVRSAGGIALAIDEEAAVAAGREADHPGEVRRARHVQQLERLDLLPELVRPVDAGVLPGRGRFLDLGRGRGRLPGTGRRLRYLRGHRLHQFRLRRGRLHGVGRLGLGIGLGTVLLGEQAGFDVGLVDQLAGRGAGRLQAPAPVLEIFDRHGAVTAVEDLLGEVHVPLLGVEEGEHGRVAVAVQVHDTILFLGPLEDEVERSGLNDLVVKIGVAAPQGLLEADGSICRISAHD